LDGTIDAFLDERIKNVEIRIMEKKTKITGLVVNGLLAITGGKSKSAVLGGLKPSSDANQTPTKISKM
jgi:hypothetical protein